MWDRISISTKNSPWELVNRHLNQPLPRISNQFKNWLLFLFFILRQAWDLAVDLCLAQLPEVIENPSSFTVCIITIYHPTVVWIWMSNSLMNMRLFDWLWLSYWDYLISLMVITLYRTAYQVTVWQQMQTCQELTRLIKNLSSPTKVLFCWFVHYFYLTAQSILFSTITGISSMAGHGFRRQRSSWTASYSAPSFT